MSLTCGGRYDMVLVVEKKKKTKKTPTEQISYNIFCAKIPGVAMNWMLPRYRAVSAVVRRTRAPCVGAFTGKRVDEILHIVFPRSHPPGHSHFADFHHSSRPFCALFRE